MPSVELIFEILRALPPARNGHDQQSFPVLSGVIKPSVRSTNFGNVAGAQISEMLRAPPPALTDHDQQFFTMISAVAQQFFARGRKIAALQNGPGKHPRREILCPLIVLSDRTIGSLLGQDDWPPPRVISSPPCSGPLHAPSVS